MTLCRYVAFVVDDAAKTEPLINRALRESGLRCCFRSERVVVLCDDPASVLRIGDTGGIILGYLFRKDGRSRRVSQFSSFDAARILSTGGEHLIRQYWGGYVALIAPRASREVHVLRDPSGQIASFIMPVAGGSMIGSDTMTMADAARSIPGIDWRGLNTILRLTSLPLTKTALIDVSEIQAGMQMTFTDRAPRASLLWDPWRFAASSASSTDQIDDLRAIIDDCVSMWAGCFNGILLSLSGGLDSSILAATLARSANRLTAVNFVDEGSSGDERVYARSVAAHLGIRLNTHLLQVDAVDVAKSTSLGLARPLGRMIGQAFDAGFSALLKTGDIAAVFDGVGGDNVFCFLQSPTPAADRLRMEGIGRGLAETMADVCALCRCSVPTALAWSIRKAWLSRASYAWRNRTDLLIDASDLPVEAAASSPWLVAPPGAVSGKAAHVAMLLRAQVRGRFVGTTPRISPLLSQPIMEYCLSIPSWRWCAGGIDRAPVRRAYASDLPPGIVSRRSKGGTETLASMIVMQNAAALSDRLAGGTLASHGLIDGDEIKRALRPGMVARGTYVLRLLELAEAEAWASFWNLPRPPAVRGGEEAASH